MARQATDDDVITPRTVVADAVTTPESPDPLLPFEEWMEAKSAAEDTVHRLIEGEL